MDLLSEYIREPIKNDVVSKRFLGLWIGESEIMNCGRLESATDTSRTPQ